MKTMWKISKKSAVLSAVLVLASTQLTSAEEAPSYPARLLAGHNSIRAQEELPALAYDALLAKAAQAHAKHMATTGEFAHEGIGDGTIVERIDAAKYDWSRAAENIAWTSKGTSDDTDMAMKVWLDSPPHKMQILSPNFQEIGFGRAVASDGKVYWVACFGSPAK